MYVYIYIYICIYIYIYIYTHTHTHTHTHRAALLHVGAVSNASQARSSSHSADCVAGWTGVYSGGVKKKRNVRVSYLLLAALAAYAYRGQFLAVPLLRLGC